MENNAYQFPLRIQIENKDFNLVKIQRDSITAIYRHNDIFLRIGDKDRISKDLECHREMFGLGFPVAEILSDGFAGEYEYFTESSLGDENFTSIFTQETSERGEISKESFHDFLSIAKKLGESQLKTRNDNKDFAAFSKDVHLDVLLEELPENAEKIKERFAKAATHLSELPFVLTHGDFNPFNTHRKGIIDLENSSYSPFGYDVVSGIGTTEYFPFFRNHESQDFEFTSGYAFSEEQKSEYFMTFDDMAVASGLPKISSFREDLMFMRAIWLLVRMQQWPKLQKFRYEKFINEYL